jgi:hypothetical protein
MKLKLFLLFAIFLFVACIPVEPTPTPQNPTNTPEATGTAVVTPLPTNTPQPTNTPNPNPIQPFIDAPQCDENPPTDTYHGLWNYDEGCYYTKTHGDNPHDLDELLGSLSDYLVAEISYPWQTFSSDGTPENVLKHDFYKWYVADYGRGYCNLSRPIADICIEAIRIQFHALEDVPSATTTIHSFWANGYACNDAGECGVFATGGHSNFAPGVHCPYKRDFCPIEGGPLDANLNQPPYTAMDLITSAFPRVQWNSGVNANPTPADAYNQSFSMDWVGRSWGGIDPADAPFVPGDMTSSECYDGECSQNGLAVRPYELIFNAHGLAGNVDLFTDVRGRLDSNCTAASENCIPFVLRNWPGGDAGLRSADIGTSTGFITQDELYHEFDILFNGESSGWAEWPN